MEKINFVNGTTIDGASIFNQMQDNIENAINNFVNVIYPIGSLYMSINSTNPSILFGGSWEMLVENMNLPIGSDVTITSNGKFELVGAYGENIGFQTPSTVINKNGGTGGALFVNNNTVTGSSTNAKLSYYGGLKGNIKTVISGVYIWKRVA